MNNVESEYNLNNVGDSVIEPEENIYTVDEIKKVLPKVSKSYKKVFELFYFDNLKHNEIAEELGISVSTVRMQLIKASGIIRETIRKKYSDEQGTDVLRIGAVSLFLLALIG